ncbi:hypothetical protein GCM10007874_60270 [Labrys miyagiensis]|uniref:Glycosyltransferase 2-like domain-containing protein n=1 Tax=Labrys miyagiensis TaxID=346912 RepID=A0ABQ6CXK8_9HYPH|nr:glycosyltransferase family 2 protein [Labrys miyagiensis]GLS23007.1 hypothetical protein GCM10007874_60270 [Labrys miyagiensis]
MTKIYSPRVVASENSAPGHPEVSVIVPAFDAEQFVKAAVTSALSQTMRSLEVIVIDDGSGDGTAQIIRDLAAKDRRVRPLFNTTRQGVSAARNTGLNAAKGNYIALLDADDAWIPNRLELMLRVMKNRGLDMLADQLEIIEFESGKWHGPAFNSSWMTTAREISVEDFLQRDWPGYHYTRNLGLMKPLVRRRNIEDAGLRFDERLSLGEDALFYVCLMLAGARLGLIPDALYLYSVRPNSLSSSPTPTMQLVAANAAMVSWLHNLPNRRKDASEIEYILRRRKGALLIQYLFWCLKTMRIKQGFGVAHLISINSYYSWSLKFILHRLWRLQERFGLPRLITKQL